MTGLVLCALCGTSCTPTGARTCDCEPGPRVEAALPRSSRLAEVAALAALDADPVFRSAVRRAAWLRRTAVDA